MDIRPAATDDSAAIRKLHLRAFPTAAEADLVERLVSRGDASVSLVATDGEGIVGHILFSRMQAEAEGRPIEALGLAPVAVLPDRQGEGIGSALIEQGLRSTQSLGAEIVFVLGDPGYYGRFGFRADLARPFESPFAGRYFQARALNERFAAPRSGTADYAPPFAELEG